MSGDEQSGWDRFLDNTLANLEETTGLRIDTEDGIRVTFDAAAVGEETVAEEVTEEADAAAEVAVEAEGEGQRNADLIGETTEEVTTPVESDEARQQRLAEEYTAAVTAARAAHAAALERGEAGFDLSGLTTLMQFFGGQEGEGGQGIAGFIDQYRAAGQGIEYEIVDGGLGLGTMLNLLESTEGGPVQIPREVYESAIDLAIVQIVNDPNMLVEFVLGDTSAMEALSPEAQAQIEEIGIYLMSLETDAQRQELIEDLQMVASGETNIIRIRNAQGESIHMQLLPHTLQFLNDQMENIVAPTLAGGIAQLGGQLEGTGILGFIREALSGIIDFAQNMLDGFGVDVNLGGALNRFL